MLSSTGPTDTNLLVSADLPLRTEKSQSSRSSLPDPRPVPIIRLFICSPSPKNRYVRELRFSISTHPPCDISFCSVAVLLCSSLLFVPSPTGQLGKGLREHILPFTACWASFASALPSPSLPISPSLLPSLHPASFASRLRYNEVSDMIGYPYKERMM